MNGLVGLSRPYARRSPRPCARLTARRVQLRCSQGVVVLAPFSRLELVDPRPGLERVPTQCPHGRGLYFNEV